MVKCYIAAIGKEYYPSDSRFLRTVLKGNPISEGTAKRMSISRHMDQEVRLQTMA